MLKSYQASAKDPDNELVHLYEIRDALVKKFGDSGALRTKLGITRNEWSRFAQLANVEPLRQGRHRGTKAGNLRDATEGELQEARQRDALLDSAKSEQAVLHLRLGLARADYEEARRRFETGTAPREALEAAETELIGQFRLCGH